MSSRSPLSTAAGAALLLAVAGGNDDDDVIDTEAAGAVVGGGNNDVVGTEASGIDIGACSSWPLSRALCRGASVVVVGRRGGRWWSLTQTQLAVPP